MPTWSDLLDAAAELPDKDEIKATLPLDYVLTHEFNLTWEDVDGRHMSLCPFHQDTRPSLAVFGDGTIAGCWSCGWKGDVFDVIGHARGVGFGAALKVASAMLKNLDIGSIKRPEVTHRAWTLEDQEAARDAARRAHLHAVSNQSVVRRYAVSRGLRTSTSELINEWYLGSSGDGIVIPHLDEHGEYTGHKVRTPWTPPIAVPGSKFTALYGAWRGSVGERLVIAEGESDTWTAASIAKAYGADAVGLPTGAGGRPRTNWIEWIDERLVLLCFDKDAAGNAATAAWSSALPYTSVSVWEAPAGSDICKAPGAFEWSLAQFVRGAI